VSLSVKLIVEAYVSLKDREAIEDLREDRQMLRAKLQASSGGIDPGNLLRVVEGDLTEIGCRPGGTQP
jgi:hypothetical protein